MTIPEGYIAGLNRVPDGQYKYRAHLYEGTYADPGLPMCKLGWNRKDYGYSIWRGQVGLGICKVCFKRAEKGLSGIKNPYLKGIEKEFSDEN